MNNSVSTHHPDNSATTTNPLIIAIDGPAGAGKSTVTREVARRLGLLYLDTGAMYRAATVAILDHHQQSQCDLDNPESVADIVTQQDISFNESGEVCLNGVVQEPRIRSPEITKEIWRVADNPLCRAYLVTLQQDIVAGRHAALEGRDATTVICPHASLKIYLDASPAERARRRLSEWQQTSQDHQQHAQAPSLEEVTAQIMERDARDQNRDVGALQLSDDAVPLLTDGLSPAEVIARIIALAVHRRPLLLEDIVSDQVTIGRSRQPGYVKVLSGNIVDPPGPWQLGLTNPSPERMPDTVQSLAKNSGGRQAGVLCQGRAALVLAGRGDQPDELCAIPMLPQTWYIIEPGCWHAVVQAPGTICAWAEASAITEEQVNLSQQAQLELQQFMAIYLPEY